jgi:prepilin-type N-terminal cleavage/methylation domain-containing protein
MQNAILWGQGERPDDLEQAGFTLIELVVVLVIVGIMSYFAIANINNADTCLHRSRRQQILSDLER